MDTTTHKRLETEVLAIVPELFSVGDRNYLQSLSRPGLVEALAHELCFVGLAPYGDTTAQAAIHTILEQHIDHWRQAYLARPSFPFSATQ
jgi:hypothetical protein